MTYDLSDPVEDFQAVSRLNGNAAIVSGFSFPGLDPPHTRTHTHSDVIQLRLLCLLAAACKQPVSRCSLKPQNGTICFDHCSFTSNVRDVQQGHGGTCGLQKSCWWLTVDQDGRLLWKAEEDLVFGGTASVDRKETRGTDCSTVSWWKNGRGEKVLDQA